MEKDQISKILISTYNQFNSALNELNGDEFEYAPDGKWSPGQQLVDRYKEKLSMGGTASSPYVPGKVSFEKKEKLQSQLTQNIEAIAQKLNKWSETQMDEFVFPHPLLGKLTIREMMYFTIHHADHHRNLIKIYLKGV